MAASSMPAMEVETAAVRRKWVERAAIGVPFKDKIIKKRRSRRGYTAARLKKHAKAWNSEGLFEFSFPTVAADKWKG
jgi:hypothetical protein